MKSLNSIAKMYWFIFYFTMRHRMVDLRCGLL